MTVDELIEQLAELPQSVRALPVKIPDREYLEWDDIEAVELHRDGAFVTIRT